MNVKLVSYSKASHEFDTLDTPLKLIAYCAKVSNPTGQANRNRDEKLVQYLIDHKHYSPFEMVNVCLEVTTTRDIARQLLRHRSFTFQEFSQRYADPTKDMDFVFREARLQDTKNRQNSIEANDNVLQREWNMMQSDVIHRANEAYKWAIEKGIAKEQARCVLPEGNTVSKLYVNGTLRSWIHYLDLRTGNGTQKEHMGMARECALAITRIFPSIEDYNHYE
jgi:thymidylate synthase (FAD)